MEDAEQINWKKCKYCESSDEDTYLEGLECSECQHFVHINCLKRGAVPGGLVGDIFFHFTCQECSTTGSEHFIRDKMPWLQAILLVLYHMQSRNAGLTKKGYFHWKVHIATFIDKNWDVIFRKDFKRKKKWTGTVSGTLSHYSPLFFKSGTSLFNEQGWWTLTYPMLSPSIIVQLNAELMLEKQKMKELKIVSDDMRLLRGILLAKPFTTEEMLKNAVSSVEPSAAVKITVTVNDNAVEANIPKHNNVKLAMPGIYKKRKLPLLPTIDSLARPKKIMYMNGNVTIRNKNDAASKLLRKLAKNVIKTKKGKQKKQSKSVTPVVRKPPEKQIVKPEKQAVKLEKQIILKPEKQIVKLERQSIVKPEKQIIMKSEKPSKFLDPLCHYNTSLEDLSRIRAMRMKVRLMGGIRKDPILSPYSSIYLKPYIRRDTTINPPWLQLMDELQTKVNQKNPNWTLSHRGPLDFTYVQPEHIPAVNSLCNQFFWTGIDLADTLEYPDFSCVVLYRKLVVGFGFLIPDVKVNESYMSFIFTRPGWRNSGIAKFMLYHLIQTSIGRDITLHVSISNPALFLYQKYGFKVEYVVLDFYDRYMRDDTRESKHAFFCRLER